MIWQWARDGTIYCLYERSNPGTSTPGPSLVLAKFNLDWLSGGQDAWSTHELVK